LKKNGTMSRQTIANAMCGAFLETDARWAASLDAGILSKMLPEQVRGNSGSALCNPLTLDDLQRRAASTQGACALTAVVTSDCCVVAHVGDCRALLVSYNVGQVDSATFEWLNEPHLPTIETEWQMVAELTRGRDLVPVRPAFDLLKNLVAEKDVVLTTADLQVALESGEPPHDRLSSLHESYAYLANRLGISEERMHEKVPRSGGILMVTRALGDLYLKRPLEYCSTYQSAMCITGAPYITCEPTITSFDRVPGV
jgi:hypothetical protein